MTITNVWPEKPGAPLNPEKDGFHWLIKKNEQWPEIWQWDTGANGWCAEYVAVCVGSWSESEGDGEAKGMAQWYSYLAPCLAPDEIARREDVKWHEGYAVGVQDVRRGTAFGEPDTHYAALQARVRELESFVVYLCGRNTDHVQVTLAGNPIVVDALVKRAEAALEGKKDE